MENLQDSPVKSSKDNRKMKKFRPTLKGVLDGLRSSVSTPSKIEMDVEETLRSEHFQMCRTVRHGFPYQPTSVAYDPVQHLLAIGTKNGSLRIFGRPGVDIHCRHEADIAVIQILFLVNEGGLVTVCSDDTLHLWNFRQKRPEIVHTLKFQRERITYCHVPFQSKWLYIGTERGNVHVANIESFSLSGYVINWNKAIELSRKTHPGIVVYLSDNPVDPNKLLIGFESGQIVHWDLKCKLADFRYSAPEALRSLSWHHEGKQFMCGHGDGSLTTWNIKMPHKILSTMMPHAKLGKDGKPEACRPITKVEWKSVRNGEPLVIFSGGVPYDKAGRTPSITVMNGKSTTVLEMEHGVVDFVVLCDTPWQHDFQEPYAIVVLLQNDLVVVDLTSPGYPCFENPYPMDIHESPVTSCQYYADCPPDLIPAFYSVGSKQKRSGFSEKSWPVKGGEWGTATCSYPEMIITGHADGSVKFWDASAVTLQVLYKLKTAKIFEKPKNRSMDGQDDDPFAIYLLYLCLESRQLCAAGATHIMLFKFSRQEVSLDIPFLEISIDYEVYDELDSPEFEYPNPTLVNQQSGSMGSYSSNASDCAKPDATAAVTSLKVKTGSRKSGLGYQTDLVCLLKWLDNEHPGNITSMSLNSSYGLLAFGNESGLAIVDYIQKTCLLNLGTPDLYGSLDPYPRAPRSPRGKKPPQDNSNQVAHSEDGPRSPTSDQSNPLSCATISSSASRSKLRTLRDENLSAIREVKSIDAEEINLDTPDTIDAIPAKTAKVDVDISNLKQKPSKEILTCEELSNLAQNNLNNLDSRKQQRISTKALRKYSVSPPKPPPIKAPPKRTLSLPGSQWPKHLLPATEENNNSIDNRKNVGLVNEIVEKNTSEQKSNKIESSLSEEEAVSLISISTDSEINKQVLKKENKRSFYKKKKNKIGKKLENSEVDADLLDQSVTRPEFEVLVDQMDNKTETGEENVRDGEAQEDGTDGGHRSFLHRMSLKVKSLVSGHDVENEEEKMMLPKCLLEVLDIRADNDKWRIPIRRVSREQIIIEGTFDKNDGSSFSRSRSSSMSSLENVSREAIQCLVFADSYTRKTDVYTCPCLWVGTSLGSVLVISLNTLPVGEQRLTEPVIVSPSGTIFRLKGGIKTMSFLDCNGILIPTQSEQWKEEKQSRQAAATPPKPKISPTSSTEISDRQFAVICSEKQARIVSLPSQNCPYKLRVTDASFVVKADILTIKDSVCLGCYVANGHVMVFSLPSFKPLLDMYFLPLTELRIARTFTFSKNGHALYLCSPTEVQKIAYSSEICENLSEMLGDLFLPCEAPEAPKQGFFKNLFGGGVSTLDREELFGEASGKGQRGLATKLPGPGGLQQLSAQAGTATNEISRARMLMIERGEKLGEMDEKTAQMMAQAESYSHASHAIMQKYKDKKWYQF